VVEDFGDAGRVEAVTASAVASSDRTAAAESGFVVFAWIWLGLVLTVLPALGVRFSLRRRRAARPAPELGAAVR
jgi:hypothetical protein